MPLGDALDGLIAEPMGLACAAGLSPRSSLRSIALYAAAVSSRSICFSDVPTGLTASSSGSPRRFDAALLGMNLSLYTPLLFAFLVAGDTNSLEAGTSPANVVVSFNLYLSLASPLGDTSPMDLEPARVRGSLASPPLLFELACRSR